MTNPLLSPAENAQLTALRSNGATIMHRLDRIDFNKLFSRAAITLNAVGVLYVCYVYSLYAAYFGVSALAFVGQFLIGLFFMACVVSNTDGLPVMLASIGMFILANSF